MAAFAIYSADDSSLTFYNRETVPAVGETYNGKTVTAVYVGFDTHTGYGNATSRPWHTDRSKFTSVVFVDKISPLSLKYWFSSCTALVSFDGNNLDTANVDSMYSLFSGCTSLESVDVSGFDTRKTTTMGYMFNNCAALTSVNLKNFDTSLVSNMTYMFKGCTGLTSLDLSSFDTGKVTGFTEMFSGCNSIVSIYVSDKWTTAKASASSSKNVFLDCISIVGQSGTMYDSAKVDYTYANYETGYLKLKGSDIESWTMLIDSSTLYAIADAIREKTGNTDRLNPKIDMPYAIRSINAGAKLPELASPGTAADLLVGKQLIDQNGNVVDGAIPGKSDADLTVSGATVTVPAGYYSENAQKAVATATQATPGISVDASGLITASATQEAGYVAQGTKSATKQMTVQAAKTVTPTTSAQTAVAAGVYTTGEVKVAAMPTATQATPSISVDSAGLITASATQSAGYVAAGTKSATKQLTTQAAKTVTPGTSAQTAVSSGVYTTGAVKVAGDANLVAANIKSGVSIFGVAGSAQAAQTVTVNVVNNGGSSMMNVMYYNPSTSQVTLESLPSSGTKTIQTSVGCTVRVGGFSGYSYAADANFHTELNGSYYYCTVTKHSSGVAGTITISR